MNQNRDTITTILLRRIADALDRLAPPAPDMADFSTADAFVWLSQSASFQPVPHVNHIALDLLKGIDHIRNRLLENSKQFAAGLPANNALLWGARGMGKSSLIKAVHAHINAHINAQTQNERLKLIEVHREEIASLPHLLTLLRKSPFRFIIFCDDLSFDREELSYKSLKAVLDGNIEGRPDNAIFYATSNRRHLVPREMIENERASAINPADTTEEKMSLSDRFGLWLGFHKCDQENYLCMVHAYAAHFNIDIEPNELNAEALEWAITRGARSGRVAWQFIQDLTGRHGITIP